MKKNFFGLFSTFLISNCLFAQISENQSFVLLENSTTSINSYIETSTNCNYARPLNRNFTLGVANNFSFSKSELLNLKYAITVNSISPKLTYYINPQKRNIFYTELESSFERDKYSSIGEPARFINIIGARIGIGVLSFYKKNEHLFLNTSFDFVAKNLKHKNDKVKSNFFEFQQTIMPVFSSNFIDKAIEDNNLLKTKRVTISYLLAYSFGYDATAFYNPDFANLGSYSNPLFLDTKIGYFIMKNFEAGLGFQIYFYAKKHENTYNLSPRINYYVPITKRVSIFPTSIFSTYFRFQKITSDWTFGAGINYFLNKHIAAQATYLFYNSEDNSKKVNVGFKYFLR